MEKISVIVPVYNIERYLDRCIGSISTQTYQNLEIVLVNDGSTDSSSEICERFAANDQRIKVVHKKNGGVVSARKAGLDIAQGEYIGFVDGDDYIEPEMYAKLLDIIRKENVDFVHSGYYKDEMPGVYGVSSTGILRVNHKDGAINLWEYALNPIGNCVMSASMWSKLYRKNFIQEAHSMVPDEISYGEDLICLCHCILNCQSFCTVDRAYYHYVTREDSAYHSKNVEKIKQEGKLYDTLCKLLQQNGLLNELQCYVQNRYLHSITACVKHLGNAACPIYQYPSVDSLFGKRVVLYGFGEVGQDYYTQLRRDTRCEVLAITDTCYDCYHLSYVDVISPEKALEMPYDFIIISVLHEHTAQVITDKLMEMGVQREKIVWKKPDLTVQEVYYAGTSEARLC